MRIAQIAPLAESVPPKLYGGTERVVAWLVDELIELGHQVTLFRVDFEQSTSPVTAGPLAGHGLSWASTSIIASVLRSGKVPCIPGPLGC